MASLSLWLYPSWSFAISRYAWFRKESSTIIHTPSMANKSTFKHFLMQQQPWFLYQTKWMVAKWPCEVISHQHWDARHISLHKDPLILLPAFTRNLDTKNTLVQLLVTGEMIQATSKSNMSTW